MSSHDLIQNPSIVCGIINIYVSSDVDVRIKIDCMALAYGKCIKKRN